MQKIIHKIQLSKKITDENGRELTGIGLGVAGNYGVHQLEVMLGEGWRGLTVTTVFHGKWGCVEMLLTGRLIDVPPQATAMPTTQTPGKITFVGVDSQGRNVSTGISYYVEASGCISGDEPELPDDKWQQLVAKFDKAVPPTDTAGLVLHSGGADAPNYWAAGGGGGGGVTPVISAVAETLPAGSAATVERSGPDAAPLFTFGIPRGDAGQAGADGITPTIGENGNWYIGDADTGKPSRGESGQDGNPGEPGAAAGFGTITATAAQLASDAQPTVQAEWSGPDTAKNLALTFGIPAGPVGPQGPAYTLTEADKQTIVRDVLAALPNGDEVAY